MTLGAFQNLGHHVFVLFIFFSGCVFGAVFFLSCSENQAIRQFSQICEKSKVRIMVLKIHLINIFRAGFLLKWHPILHKNNKFKGRNFINLKIRHCLISGCLISGGCLIDHWSDTCRIKIMRLIRRLPD